MSRHHVKDISSIVKNANATIKKIFLFNMINLDDTKDKIPFEANKGQGLCSTK
jgi:hypothetical protein